jgi:hypothetical protein
MPMFQALVSSLNTSFHPDQIAKLAVRKDEFAPGKALDLSFVAPARSPLQKVWVRYIKSMPPTIQETLRGVIHQALSASPPRLVTFAWAPAYDFEITVWDAPCGITVLIKSRYPADAEPNRGDPKP